MQWVGAIALAVVCVAVAAGDAGIPEPADSKVHVVTYDNFNRFVRQHPLVLMEFYAPWCGHCQNLAPVYREAAQMMSEADLPVPVTFAKFNDGNEYNRQLRGGAEDMFNYTGYPALILFKEKKHPVANKEHWKKKYLKKKWQFYGGGRESPDDFVFYLSAVSKGLDPFDEERKVKPGFYKKGGKHETDKILDLEPEGEMGFNKTVLADPENTLWVVEFYSDRCPFCNSLAPEITKAAENVLKELKGAVKFAAVNSRVFDEIATQHEVTSWPWVAAFYNGKKVEDMAGLGGWESVVRFSKESHSKYWTSSPPPNTFISSGAAAAAGGDGAAAAEPNGDADAGSGGVDAKATLEELLADALKYNLKSERGVQQLRKQAEDGKLDSVVADLAAKLKPVHELQEKIAKLSAKVEL